MAMLHIHQLALILAHNHQLEQQRDGKEQMQESTLDFVSQISAFALVQTLSVDVKDSTMLWTLVFVRVSELAYQVSVLPEQSSTTRLESLLMEPREQEERNKETLQQLPKYLHMLQHYEYVHVY